MTQLKADTDSVSVDGTEGKPAEQDSLTKDLADDKGEPNNAVIQLAVSLPHEPHKLQLLVSQQEAIQDLRQAIVESPQTFQYSCFHLEHKDKPINDFVTVAEVDDLFTSPDIKLVEDPYTEKEARVHVIRVRELIGATTTSADTIHGVSAGQSLHDAVFAERLTLASNSAKADDDYHFNEAGSLSTLLPQKRDAPPKTVKSLTISPWNPPPYYLRQRGHLLYLSLTTNEGEQYNITSHVSGFYVNKCSNTKFDPHLRTTPKRHHAHSLLTLMADLSLSFQGMFNRLVEHNNAKEPLSVVPIVNTPPASPWAVLSPASSLAAHCSDIARSQENYLVAGIESAETLRDWNEEFQSTKELPKVTVQDRVFRERLTSKLFADYADAAARGAIMVARGEVAPLNPTEARNAQIFVYNNIFFSFGADGVGTFASEGGDEAARVATGKDVMGVQIVNQLDIDGLYTAATVVVDYLGKRIVAQSIVPGIFKQREPDENQIDYGAVDGRDLIASDEAFSPLFAKLSKALKVKKHAVWDTAGKRHELEGSVETKGLLGTDGRRYALDLYRITPLDISWLEESATSSDADSKSPHRSQHAAYPHRMTVLRPELVESYWKQQLRAWANAKLQSDGSATKNETEPRAAIKDTPQQNDGGVQPNDNAVATSPSKQTANGVSGLDKIDISEFEFALNPDVFGAPSPQNEEELEAWAEDEVEVRKVCDYLRTTVIQGLVQELESGDVSFPMDGQSLSRLLHKRGINIRYIGKLAELAQGKKLEALRVLTHQSMITRAFKHVAAKYFADCPGPLAVACIAHLLNCLLGSELNNKPTCEIDNDLASLYSHAKLAFRKVTADSLHREIEDQIALRYRYKLQAQWPSRIRHMQQLREICQALGLQIEARDYCFSPNKSTQPTSTSTSNEDSTTSGTTNGHSSGSKKKRKNRETSPSSNGVHPHTQTFHVEDIINVVPVIKEASPRSMLAEEALEAGRISIINDQIKVGQELLLESLTLHEQIYGLLHPEVARVYNSLSMLYYNLQERDAAMELARKAVVISERTLGVDHADTLLNYLNLSLVTHACGQTADALIYLRHALELWKVVYGPNHPDSITTLNNAAVMLQQLKDYRVSRKWFETSLEICTEIFGRDSVNAATLLFQLAQALALDSDSKAAVAHMRESYNIFLAELGPEDKNTKEAEKWLEQLTTNAVSIARHAKDMAARGGRLRILNRTVSLDAGRTDTTTAQSTAASMKTQGPGEMDKRSIDELIRYIEGTDQQQTTPKKRAGRNNPKRRGGAAAAAAAMAA